MKHLDGCEIPSALLRAVLVQCLCIVQCMTIPGMHADIQSAQLQILRLGKTLARRMCILNDRHGDWKHMSIIIVAAQRLGSHSKNGCNERSE